jgi:hypothetical protein
MKYLPLSRTDSTEVFSTWRKGWDCYGSTTHRQDDGTVQKEQPAYCAAVRGFYREESGLYAPDAERL